MVDMTNAFDMAQRQFDHVGDMLGLDPQVAELLRWPEDHVHFEVFKNGRVVDPSAYIHRASR